MGDGCEENDVSTTLPKSRTNSRKRTALYRALIAWNFLPSHIAQRNSKLCFKKPDKTTPRSTTPLPDRA